MAAPSTPSTSTPVVSRTVVSSDPAGTWTHPRMDEINRRVRASTFGERNVHSIAMNALAFFVAMLLPRFAALLPLPFEQLARAATPWSTYLLLACRLAPLLLIGIDLYPLWRVKDDLSDIPLTPKQRMLLGLPPSSKPATPGSTYITPPRYSRSATPRSDASSRSGSPYSGSRGASPIGTTAYSPSPLFQKAMNRDVERRLSFGGGGSPLQSFASGKFGADSLRIGSSTPSPKTGQAAGVGLTSRWLYEKGRTSSMSRSIYS